MSQFCKRITGLCVVTTTGMLVGACDASKSNNPLSPSIAGPIAGVTISAPAGLRPTGGAAIDVSSQPIALSFGAATSNSPRAFWYETEIATAADFSAMIFKSPRIEHPSGASQIQFSVQTRLAPEQTYYWRVRALDGSNTGPYSDMAMFKVATPVVLGAPEPVSPVNGVTTPTTQPTFVVNAGTASGPAGPVTYEFQVSKDGSFNEIANAFTAASGGPTTSAQSGTLPPGQALFWRVRATDGPNASAWSATPTFNTPAPPLTLACPPAQTATSPDGLPVEVNYPAAVPGGGVPPYAIDYSQPPGRPFPVGTSVVTAVTSDASGQRAECTFTVAVAAPAPPPAFAPAPPPATGGGGGSSGDELDVNQVTWLDYNVSGWPVTSTVTGVSIGDPPVCIEHTKAGRWPNVDGGEGNPWIFANINGRWYAATYEWLKPGQTCKGVNRNDIGAHTKEPPIEGWKPRSGELVGLMVSTRARFGPEGPRNERSNIVLVRWP